MSEYSINDKVIKRVALETSDIVKLTNDLSEALITAGLEFNALSLLDKFERDLIDAAEQVQFENEQEWFKI